MFETLGVYKILEHIGAGGIGDVYRARDTRLGRTVAVKVVAPAIASDSQRRERFLADARAAALLSHPNIAALYETGEDQGQLFLAIEFVPGETLHAAIGGRPMNPKLAIEYAVQIADALADAHGAGVVHGALNSDNVLVTPKGRVKVLDFGFAEWTIGAARRRAAEQPAPPRADIFSLGAMMFEMLTGRPLVDASAERTPADVAAQAPSSLNAAVPRELDPIVQKMVSNSAGPSYEAAATVAAELRSVAAILDERAAAAERDAPSHARGRRAPVIWATLVLVVVALALAWLALRS